MIKFTESLIRNQIQDELKSLVRLTFFNNNSVVKAIKDDDGHIFWFEIINCVTQQLPDRPDKLW